ncbi:MULTISPECIES: DUF6392 family protein [unclassified Pseudomonas]|nr:MULTISPECIES: DUF6392 family protein [unclassified Pseudomonas]MEA9979991.1 DUF6392 family protein [Pseudomonas sp. RTS4]MEB0198179.1 DUF6392 family protein [Pseudomonas sp. 5S4]MEB0247832.1 DUF6392 family protein [Pseudomonas sp. 10S5]
MERLIKNLGCTYDALIANKVIDYHPLRDMYEDGESLEIEPVPGIELIFWPETLRFEVIYITLKDEQTTNLLPIYGGELPEPFKSVTDQKEVQKAFGEPMFSKGAIALRGTGLSGWDTYQLDSNLHPAAMVEFQYVKNMKISKLLFSVIDKNV